MLWKCHIEFDGCGYTNTCFPSTRTHVLSTYIHTYTRTWNIIDGRPLLNHRHVRRPLNLLFYVNNITSIPETTLMHIEQEGLRVLISLVFFVCLNYR